MLLHLIYVVVCISSLFFCITLLCVCSITQLCPTLYGPIDCSLPGFSVHGIFQTTILEWDATSYCRGSSQPRDQTWGSHLSHIGRWVLYHRHHLGGPSLYYYLLIIPHCVMTPQFIYPFSLYFFPRAVITKQYKPGDLKHQKCINSQFWRPGGQQARSGWRSSLTSSEGSREESVLASSSS